MVHPLIERLITYTKHKSGSPVALQKAIDDHPDMRVSFTPQPLNIEEGSILRWNQFGEGNRDKWPHFSAGQLHGWTQVGDTYIGHILNVPDLERIGTIETIERYTLDISQVFGLGASKSELRDFTSLEDFTLKRCPDFIKDCSEEGLAKNLAHDQIRILKDNGPDFFSRYAWDDRIWLCNAGGSHHFAAARWIAMQLGLRVPLTGRLITHSINLEVVERLSTSFRGILISSKPKHYEAFHNAMRAFGAAYYGLEMRRQHQDTKVVLLPRNDQRSMAAAEAFDHSGYTDAIDTLRAIALKAKRNLANKQEV